MLVGGPHGFLIPITTGTPAIPGASRPGIATGTLDAGAMHQQVLSARIVPFRCWQVPVASLVSVIEKHAVAFWATSPAGRGMITQIGVEQAPGARVSVPAGGENETGP